MSAPELDQPMPDFSCAATGDQQITLSELRGQNVVVYFYPKDSTPGCTTEGQDFRDLYGEFQAANCVILGVSRDSLKSHERFKQKQEFPFELLADEDETLCRLFDVIHEKNMYGRKSMGVVRSTFIVDAQGILRHALRKVKVKGHVDEVLDLVKAL
ncbi:MAG: peroxiredoxin [Gammaproteobacteria bacterium]